MGMHNDYTLCTITTQKISACRHVKLLPVIILLWRSSWATYQDFKILFLFLDKLASLQDGVKFFALKRIFSTVAYFVVIITLLSLKPRTR